MWILVYILVYLIYPVHRLQRLHHVLTTKLPNWLRITNQLFDQVFISPGKQFENFTACNEEGAKNVTCP